MKTSIHIEPVKPSSEAHNKREKALDYVRNELSHLNEYWECDTQSNRLALIKSKYEASVGQIMQKKATPIREGVVVIQKNTTMADLQRLASEYERRFGIHVFQISIHKDEGHVAAKNWKPNLHAHLVFDWSDLTTGRSMKLSRQQMAEMQTITAEVLEMERGKASDKKHLSSVAYKIEQKEKQLKKLQKKLQTIELAKASKETLISLLELTKGILNQSSKDKEIKTLRNEISQLQMKLSMKDTIIHEKNKAIAEEKRKYSELDREAKMVASEAKEEKRHSNEIYNLYLELKNIPKMEKLKEILAECQNNAIDVINDKKGQPWLEDSLVKLYNLMEAKSYREREALGRYVVATVENKLSYEQSIQLGLMTDRIAEEAQTRSQGRGWFGRG